MFRFDVYTSLVDVGGAKTLVVAIAPHEWLKGVEMPVMLLKKEGVNNPNQVINEVKRAFPRIKFPGKSVIDHETLDKVLGILEEDLGFEGSYAEVSRRVFAMITTIGMFMTLYG